MLYFIAFLSFGVTYWTDKYLVLRFYRITEGFSAEQNMKFIKWLPFALVLHSLFGIMMFSYPSLLHSARI